MSAPEGDRRRSAALVSALLSPPPRFKLQCFANKVLAIDVFKVKCKATKAKIEWDSN